MHPMQNGHFVIQARLARADHRTGVRICGHTAKPLGNRLCGEPYATSAKVDAAQDLHSKNMSVKR
jgi:hypothetical protein